MNEERQATQHAECFARFVLAGQEDAYGRSRLDHAERTADRVPMHWEKTIAWLAAALDADRVDETILTGIGFKNEDVQPRDGRAAAGR